jgi:hypothetical protein
MNLKKFQMLILVAIIFLSVTTLSSNAKTFKVSTADELCSAFKTVNPGDSISLAKGVYNSSKGTEFELNRSGNATNPITMYSTSSQTMLTAGKVDSGRALFMSNANHWIIRSIFFIFFHINDFLTKLAKLVVKIYNSRTVEKAYGPSTHRSTFLTASTCTILELVSV